MTLYSYVPYYKTKESPFLFVLFFNFKQSWKTKVLKRIGLHCSKQQTAIFSLSDSKQRMGKKPQHTKDWPLWGLKVITKSTNQNVLIRAYTTSESCSNPAVQYVLEHSVQSSMWLHNCGLSVVNVEVADDDDDDDCVDNDGDDGGVNGEDDLLTVFWEPIWISLFSLMTMSPNSLDKGFCRV